MSKDKISAAAAAMATMEEENGVKSVHRTLNFIFSLYGKKYKEEKSFNTRINGLVTRAFPNGQNNAVVTRALTLSRKISAKFSMIDALPLTPEDICLFTNVLEKFAKDISTIIAETPHNPYCLGTRAFQFQRQWNEAVKVTEGQFLEGYGDLYTSELRLSGAEDIAQLLIKLRKARKMPTRALNSLHDKLNQRAITESIQAHTELQNFQAGIARKSI